MVPRPSPVAASPRARLPLLLVACAWLAACAQAAPPPDPPRPVRAQRVVLAAATPDESYTGAVRARVESELAFRVGGKVVERRIDAGQRVRAGDVLATLDAADYGLDVAAAVNQQRAAAVEAEQAAVDAERLVRLHAEGAISRGDAERQQARATAARERLDQARRQAELARNRVDYTVLRAPADGVVTAVRLEPGQVVGAGQAVIGFAAAGEREIVVDLPETRVTQARQAPRATAALWSQGEAARFAVTLRELAPAADPTTRTYRARYRIDGEAGERTSTPRGGAARPGAVTTAAASRTPALELGMTATVWLRAADASAPQAAVATLPASALHHQQGQPAVWVIGAASRHAELRPVTVVRYGQDEVQVRGLEAGTLVVTAGVQKLTPTLAVIAVDDEGRPLARPGAPAPATGTTRPGTPAPATEPTRPAAPRPLAVTAAAPAAR